MDWPRATHSGLQMENAKVNHLETQMDFHLEKNLDYPTATHWGQQKDSHSVACWGSLKEKHWDQRKDCH